MLKILYRYFSPIGSWSINRQLFSKEPQIKDVNYNHENPQQRHPFFQIVNIPIL